MANRLTRFFAGLRGRLERLPFLALLAVGGVAAGATGAGGYYAFQTYDYVQHDNEFCFSCHLMAEPYEAFAESEHRGLGCKACHQPNLIERSQMGVTGVVFDPDTISVHAEVPNDLCADCHVNGDPEKWTLVANSVGHRVHLESTDPDLEGLQCVECHATGLHEFSAVDQTCAQSGCHVDSKVQLGAMSDLTIHCAACHGFSAPIAEDATLANALQPDESTCLSCHAMRVLVELPDPDPHEAACAACHNPHEQVSPAEAVESCATGDCHTDPTSLTPYHEGLEPEVADDCLYCHQAHDFNVDGANCVACHSGIMDDDTDVERRSASVSPHQTNIPVRRMTLVAGEALMHSWNGPLPQTLDFLHSEHPSVDCADCHESSEQHGVITVTTVTDCRTCHHADDRIAVDGCAACHESSGTVADPYSVRQTLSFTTGGSAVRDLGFAHEVHEAAECADCHTEGVELSAAAVDCASCHEDHHEPSQDCSSCHVDAPDEVHPVAQAHVTCSGAGCHQDTLFDDLPPTRPVCLVCHQDLADHRPDGDCAECHALSGFELE